MRVALQNLIQNAVAYRRPDVPPVISVSGQEAGAGVVVRVEDRDRRRVRPPSAFTWGRRNAGWPCWHGTGIGPSQFTLQQPGGPPPFSRDQQSFYAPFCPAPPTGRAENPLYA
ncbi:hypothetical protein ASG77_03235 [Arthrobacter sp. Soil762]|nr:hypothetical protein ASG77_03235 [Arthrobacter sp. Soil762]